MAAGISHDAGRMKLDPELNKTAAAEQRIVVAAADRAKRHYLRFRIGGVPGDAVRVTVGTASGGRQLLDGTYLAGVHIAAFTPPAGNGALAIWLRFTKRTGWPAWIDGVRFFSSEPLELPTRWDEEALWKVTYDQSYDVMTCADAAGHPQDIVRTQTDAFSIEGFANLDGPYLDENPDDAVTIHPAEAMGPSVTLTASAELFRAGDVGRHITIRHIDDDAQGVWGWGIIRQVASGTAATVEVRRAFGQSGDDHAVPSWRLGAWSAASGWPATVAYHDGRQHFGGGNTAEMARRIDGSAQPGYNRFTFGTGDADAWTQEIAARGRLRHLISGGHQLLALTTSVLRGLSGNGISEAITPTRFADKAVSLGGASRVRPMPVGAYVLFASKDGQRIYAVEYNELDGGFTLPNLSLISEDILHPGLADATYAAVPWPHFFGATVSGDLAVLIHMPEESITGWSRYSVAGGAIESLATRVGSGGDEVWALIRYTVGGREVRYIERLDRPLQDASLAEPRAYLDSARTVANRPPASLAIGTPVVEGGVERGVFVRASGGIFAAGDVGREICAPYLSAGTGKFGTNEMILSGGTIVEVRSSTDVVVQVAEPFFSTELADGEWLLSIDEVTGLDHLEGETVMVIGDGFRQEARQVSGGRVEVDPPAGMVQVGRDYAWRWLTLPIDVRASIGTGQGRPALYSRLLMRVLHAGSFEAGLAGEQLYRQGGLNLATGDLLFDPGGGWQSSASFELRGEAGPFECLLIVPTANVGEAL